MYAGGAPSLNNSRALHMLDLHSREKARRLPEVIWRLAVSLGFLSSHKFTATTFFRVRPIRVKWPMFDVPIFRQKNSDSDGRCRCLVGTVTSVDVDKSLAQAYACIHRNARIIYCKLYLLYYC